MAGVNCGKLDLTKLPQDELITINDQTWIKTEVDEKIYIVSGKPSVVIKFSDMCSATVCDDQNDLNPALAGLMGQKEADSEPEPSENCDPAYESCSQDKTRSLPEEVNNDREDLQQAQTAVDINSLNVFSWYGAAVKPAAAVVPMKSNIRTYGPYASSNFGLSKGGTQVEVNTDLAPWVFGSIEAMNIAGSGIVESTAIGLIKAETGSITIPGLPTSSFTNLGVALGGVGPTLSSINFSYGSNGVTTNYEFKTYTPKFGGLNRHLLDKVKNIAKNRTEQLRFLRNNQITQNKISRKLRAVNRANNAQGGGGTLQRVLIGEIYDWQEIGDEYSQRTVVGMDSLRKSVNEMAYDYNKKAFVSLDALYGPISKNGDGGLPRYANFEPGCHKSSPLQPQPPFTIETEANSGSNVFNSGLNQYNLEITQDYTDPLTNPFSTDEHHHNGDGVGHVIDLIGRNNEIPSSGLITNFYNLSDENRYSSDYRFLGMRGPILLHSWGYDTDGKPIPNEADVESAVKSGDFTSENLKDGFLQDWLGKPNTWPVAPIDFRFDRKRGLWVTPPGYKVVVAKLDEKLDAYGSAIASLINRDATNNLEFGPDLYNKDGEVVLADDSDESKAKIKVVDRLGNSYSSGTKMYCYYDTFNCEYIVIEGSPKKSIRFRIIDMCENTPASADYGDSWTQYAGYGDKFPNNHILGIRIDCEGNPIDRNGNIVTHDDIINPDKSKDILINLFDTCGTHGPSYALYESSNGQLGFNKWKQLASTGFGLVCDPQPENTCIMGEAGTQCSSVNPEYDSYDIVFMEGYARFVECELQQKLYISTSGAMNEYPGDDYKNLYPEGNASATIKEFYGNSPNGKSPIFYKDNMGGVTETPFRVFDPYVLYPKEKNPFANLDEGDKVLAIFDDTKKKYIIYSALNKETEKVIKFALVDNKDIGDRMSRAVLVDVEGYPIDVVGTRLTDSNFQDNFISVIDPFAVHGYGIPTPNYHNFGTTGFGPALGSDNLAEHLNGIALEGGDQDPPSLPGGGSSSSWTGGPFIGFAIQRKVTAETSSTFPDYDGDYYNEIFHLETFAQIVQGKIASTYPIIDSAYYLAVREPNGYVDGRVPITREAIAEEPKFNLRVFHSMFKFEDDPVGGKYITGDWYDDTGNNRIDGDVYNSVDGCRFLAKLDHVTSKVNNGSEKLYYTIIEVENIANRGKTVLTKKERSNELNSGEVEEKTEESDGIFSTYLDGFMWDKTKSKTNYEKTTIYNRQDWTGKALIMKWNNAVQKHICTSLLGYDPLTGAISYQVDYAGTIAQVAEGTVPSAFGGRFGKPGIVTTNNGRISKMDTPLCYHGLSPLILEEDEQPAVSVNNPWMTYESSPFITLYNETSSSQIDQSKYRVIYAREAPVIITGKAAGRFTPETANNIQITLFVSSYPSCPGSESTPVPTLLTKVKNPMGYGAEEGDLVTVQRVFSDTVQDNANYYYIVIGTSAVPQP